MKLIENIGKLSTLDIEEATLGPLHPFPNWVLNHDLNDTVCYLTLNFDILFSVKNKNVELELFEKLENCQFSYEILIL